MKLNKKHIGQLFDNKGSDGSWAYQLVAIKGKELMFYCMSTGEYEVDTNTFADWRHFKPQMDIHYRWIEEKWKTARRAPCDF